MTDPSLFQHHAAHLIRSDHRFKGRSVRDACNHLMGLQRHPPCPGPHALFHSHFCLCDWMAARRFSTMLGSG